MPADLTNLDLDSLYEELYDLESHYPQIEDHERFVLWFLLAYASDGSSDAASALTGWSRERGMDAVLIDDDAQRVFIVQGKLRERLMGTKEKKEDLEELAEKVSIFADEDRDFSAFLKSLEPLAKQSARRARERLMKRGYTLSLCYVTTGRFDRAEVKAVEKLAKNSVFKTEYLTFDGRAVIHLLRNYLEGSAPFVPDLDLPLTSAEIVGHVDLDLKDVESWVFTMNGKAVADLYDEHGIKLFHKNIRGFLGIRSEVNEAIASTIDERPELFWYFNNGVTILCDQATVRRRPLCIRAVNAQVINGQQTTRTLHEAGSDAADTDVLVRLIQVADHERHPDLTKHVVEATNSQNKIDVVDMKSNAPEQVWLERALLKRGYHYVRKRQAPGEIRTPRGQIRVTKEVLARAVAGTDVEARPFHVGRKPLFDDYYDEIFSTERPIEDYLARFWLLKLVGSAVRGRNDTYNYGRWLALYVLWRDVKSMKRRPRAFIEACERNDAVLDAFDDANRRLLRMISSFANKSRGRGRSPRLFFQSDRRHGEFKVFVARRANARAYREYKEAVKEFDTGLRQVH